MTTNANYPKRKKWRRGATSAQVPLEAVGAVEMKMRITGNRFYMKTVSPKIRKSNKPKATS